MTDDIGGQTAEKARGDGATGGEAAGEEAGEDDAQRQAGDAGEQGQEVTPVEFLGGHPGGQQGDEGQGIGGQGAFDQGIGRDADDDALADFETASLWMRQGKTPRFEPVRQGADALGATRRHRRAAGTTRALLGFEPGQVGLDGYRTGDAFDSGVIG